MLSDDDNSRLMIAILRIKKTTLLVVRILMSYYIVNLMFFLQKCKGKESLHFRVFVCFVISCYERIKNLGFFGIEIV